MIYDLPQPTVIDVIFRSYLQEALHVSESKLRNIVEHSVDGVVVVDPDGCIVMWNSGQERITGIPAGEALGQQIWDVQFALTPTPRQDVLDRDQLRERFHGFLQAANGDRPPPSIELEIAHTTGDRRIVQQFAFVIPTVDGHRVGFVFRDVTDLRQTTKNLLRRNAELNLLNRINRVLASSLDLQQVRKTVLKEVIHLLDTSEASIWLMDEGCGELVCIQSLNRGGEPASDAALRAWRPIAERTFAHRRTLVIAQAVAGCIPLNTDERLSQAGSLVCVPLEFQNAVYGVLLVTDEAPARFNKDDVGLLESIAAAVAVAFENARLVQKAQQLAILQERQRLAVNLHDAINQSLFSAGLIAEVLPRLIERDPMQASDSVQDLRKLLRGAVADLREVLADIQPPLLSNAGFGELLRQLAAGYSGRTGTTVAISITTKVDFAAALHEPLYRLCREVFTNIAKHAEATQVWVELAPKDGGAEITIRDNGRGFNVHRISTGHYGLAMLRQLAARIGGQLRIVSQLEQGTEVTIFVPYGGRHER